MARKTSKRTIKIGLAVLIVLVALLSTIAIIRAAQPKEQDPYKQAESSKTEDSSEGTPKVKESKTYQEPTEKTAPQTEEPTLDPATVGTIDIQPLSVTVSYVKGVGAFEYEVLRTQRGTQYVEFRSAELVGTKCTDDKGVFASILANPKSDEGATLAKMTNVDGADYGLSLAGTNCTSDASKLQTYQKSFSDAFSLLKKLN